MEPLIIHRIAVWELPVRFFHWINAGCIVMLAATGFIIGRPLSLQVGGEAYSIYWFGTVRFIHFLAAFIFFYNFVYRIYWGFVGNRHARWDQFIPFRKAQWQEIVQVLKVDILQARAKPLHTIGHNSLAGLTYFLSFLAFLFQSVSGFGMYAAMSQSWFPRRFAWIVPLMGGDFAVRQWHHMMMWFFLIFAMVHVYLTFYHDYVEGRGVISSMASGWKYIEQPDAKEKETGPGGGMPAASLCCAPPALNGWGSMAKSALILGIGNLLMGDEGAGCHAVSCLKMLAWPPGVELVDGGTGGFHLLGLFDEYNPVIIIDACMDDRSPGSVRVFHPRFNSEFPPLLSMHDIGLRDLLEAATLLGTSPQVHLVAISIDTMQPMSIELSPQVQSSLKNMPSIIESLLRKFHGIAYKA